MQSANFVVTFFRSATGISQVKQHIETKNHQKKDEVVVSCQKLQGFFSSSKGTAADMKVALGELAISYHHAKHGISINSASCHSKLIRELFESKFKCSARKTSAIIKNVISSKIVKNIKSTISQLNFLTLISDASNRKSTKLYPIMARGFDMRKGVNYLLQIDTLTNETAVTITKALM